MQARIEMRTGKITVTLLKSEENVLQQAKNLFKMLALVDRDVNDTSDTETEAEFMSKTVISVIDRVLDKYGSPEKDEDTSGSAEPEVAPVVEKMTEEEQQDMVKTWGRKKAVEAALNQPRLKLDETVDNKETAE